jgi:uncharacterized OsmC-like protein
MPKDKNTKKKKHDKDTSKKQAKHTGKSGKKSELLKVHEPEIIAPEIIVPELPPFRDRQRALKNAYRDNPALARQVSAVYSVTPDNAGTGKVRIAIENEGGISIDIGAHSSVGGTEDTGCSGDYFLASLAACYEITLRLVAAASRIELHKVALRVEGDWDARGTLGMAQDVPVGFTALRIIVDVDASGPEDRIATLPALTERYCVVSQTLKQPPQVEIRCNLAHPVGV